MYIHKWLYRLYNLDTSSLHGTRCPCRRFAKIARSQIRPPSWQKVPRNLPPSFPTHPVRSGAVYIEIFNRRSLPIKYCMILYAFKIARTCTTVMMIMYDGYITTILADDSWRSFMRQFNSIPHEEATWWAGRPSHGSAWYSSWCTLLARPISPQTSMKPQVRRKKDVSKDNNLPFWSTHGRFQQPGSTSKLQVVGNPLSLIIESYCITRRLHHSSIILCAVMNGYLLSNSR